ncbi:MAG: c-type cytochrome [Actinomycetota bacterium]|nr:c-type cytochrome [Actinomycetota bacterium]
MTEVPEHLLERSRARRRALGLPVEGDDGGGDAAAAPAAGGGAATPAVAQESLPKGPVAPDTPVKSEPPPPPPVPPYVEAFERRRKIPFWAMPVVLGLPMWAIIYAGTLEPAPTGELSLIEEGAEVYSGGAGCSTCHGGAGGGGVGPALADGAVQQTFSDPVDQVRWIITGSAGAEGGVYGDTNKPSVGGMPAFAGTLTLEEIVAVTLDERIGLGGVEDEVDWSGLTALPEEFPDAVSEAEVEEVLLLLEEEGYNVGEGEGGEG